MGTVMKDPQFFEVKKQDQESGYLASFQVNTSNKENAYEAISVASFDEKITEYVRDNFKAGTPVYLDGSLRTRRYTDKSGVEKKVWQVYVSRNNRIMTLGKTNFNDSFGHFK